MFYNIFQPSQEAINFLKEKLLAPEMKQAIYAYSYTLT